MDVKKIIIQVIVGSILFAVILVILEKDYSQEVWLEKGVNAIVFGVFYGVFLVVREKFFKKTE